MFAYILSVDNPEGTDFQIEFDHEKQFSREEFNDICEEALVYAFERTFEKFKQAYAFSLDQDFLFEYLEGKGFVRRRAMMYVLEPNWSIDAVKSKKLLEWLNSEGENKPGYMK